MYQLLGVQESRIAHQNYNFNYDYYKNVEILNSLLSSWGMIENKRFSSSAHHTPMS